MITSRDSALSLLRDREASRLVTANENAEQPRVSAHTFHNNPITTVKAKDQPAAQKMPFYDEVKLNFLLPTLMLALSCWKSPLN